MIKLSSRFMRALMGVAGTVVVAGGLYAIRSGVADTTQNANAEQQSVIVKKSDSTLSKTSSSTQAVIKAASSKASSKATPAPKASSSAAKTKASAKAVAPKATKPAVKAPAKKAPVKKAPVKKAPVKKAPVKKPAPKPAPKPAQRYAASTLYFAGRAVHYITGNQSMGSAPASGASTWGGFTNYSHTNGGNTHFIGHSPGAFQPFLSMGVGSKIVVTDRNGVPKTYTVYQVVNVNDHAVSANGTNYWNTIVGTGGGQRITIQTCITDTLNRILFAR